MDVEGAGDCLDLDFGHLAELHSRQLELGSVAVDLPQTWLPTRHLPALAETVYFIESGSPSDACGSYTASTSPSEPGSVVYQ